jgi:hypothetical protein
MTHVIDRIDVDNPVWPWKVLMRIDSRDILGVPDLSIKEMLDQLVTKFDTKRLFLFPPQGNDNVIVMGEKRGDNAVEVHIVSIDGTFATYLECKRLLKFIREKTPYRLILAKTDTPGLDSLILRLGFSYDYEIKNHSFLGSDFKYFHLVLE